MLTTLPGCRQQQTGFLCIHLPKSIEHYTTHAHTKAYYLTATGPG